MKTFNFFAAIRAWRDSWIYVLANVLSLGVGFSICTIGYFNLDFNYNFNAFFPNASEVYKVNSVLESPSGVRTSSASPFALAAQFTDGQDVRASRITYGSGVSRVEDRLFSERVGYCDPGFLEMFPFGTSDGRIAGLTSTKEVILHRRTADRLFPDGKAVGQDLEMEIQGHRTTFRVRQVIEKYPENTSFYFTVLLHMEVYENLHALTATDWSHRIDATFVQGEMAPGGLVDELNAFLDFQNREEGLKVLRYELMDAREWPSHASSLLDNVFRHGLHPASVLGTVSSAIFVLLLACFNFINTNLALAGKRMKQMAVKKVMGAGKREILVQLLVENTLLVVMALGVSVAISYFLFPYYNAMFPFNIVQMDFIQMGPFLGFTLLLVSIVVLASSLYPSRFINKVPLLSVFRGSWQQASNRRILAVLLALQFIICFYNIFSLLIFSENAGYQRNMDRGYDVESVLNVPAGTSQQQRVLKAALEAEPLIEQVASTAHVIGFNHDQVDVAFGGAVHSVAMFGVGNEYMETLGVELIEGRDFRSNESPGNTILVNETFKELVGQEVLDQNLRFETTSYRVVGVVKDFNLRTILLKNKIKPTVIMLSSDSLLAHSVVSFDKKNAHVVDDAVKAVWYELFPDQLYKGYFQEKVLRPLEETNNIILNINSFVAVAALLISIIGLYSAVSLSVQRRIKEFGVRKVLGASTWGIAYLLNKDLILILAVAGAIGLTSGYFFIDNLLDIIYAYHLEIGVRHFLFPILAVASAVLIAIGTKVHHAANANPVEQLRAE